MTLVVVPGTYMTKVAYGHGIGAAGIGQFSTVANKLLAIFGEGVGLLVPEQAIVLLQTLWDIIRVKNPTDSEIEVVFQSGTHDVESAAMAALNVIGKEYTMSVAPIPYYMVYNGFTQDISASLVLKKLQDRQNNSPMRDHMLSFLRSYMVVIWINIYTNPFAPQVKFY